MNQSFSRKELSQMTMLSERTLRTYQKEGRLKGQKIKGHWRYSEDEVSELFEDRFVKKSLEIKNRSLVDDFMEDRFKVAPTICSVYDCPVDGEEEAEEFCDNLMLEISKYEIGLEKMSYFYDTKKQLIRVTLIGNPETIVSILQYCAKKSGKSD